MSKDLPARLPRMSLVRSQTKEKVYFSAVSLHPKALIFAPRGLRNGRREGNFCRPGRRRDFLL